MPSVNLGRVKMIYQGDYSALTTYKVNDIVTYESNAYFCIQTSTDNLPTDPTYFKPFIGADLGSMALQRADDVVISGGRADSFTLGQDDPAPATVTDLETTGIETLRSGRGIFAKANPD